MSSSAPKMDAHAIRAAFLDFFSERGHSVVSSSPLVPQNDPTLLFVNAGMVQFKDVFTGRQSRPYSRATSAQRCLRAGGKHNDLDNVGFTPRHHTLFEMLGNFSFGDYFKEDAIRWAWSFLTESLGIDPERLVVSVYNGEGENAPFDQEAYDLWAKIVPRDRIYACGAKENFWQMGDTGPCGPCSEIHIFREGKAPPDAQKDGKYGPEFEEDRYTELWNLVFMQYEKLADGTLQPLPKPCVDTGAGLERLAAVMADADNNYDTDLLRPLVETARDLVRRQGGDASKNEAGLRVIADHARATSFLIADGVFPDKAGRSYVLRRIMRRAIRYGTSLGLNEAFFHEVCAKVVDEFSTAYPELKPAKATIDEVVRTEEEQFRRTLSRGLKRLEAALEELEDGNKDFPVDVAAELYDTYGFPIDLTGVIAREHGLGLDEDAAEKDVQRRQAGGAAFSGKDQGIDSLYFQAVEGLSETKFEGYEITTAEGSGAATLLRILRSGALVDEATAGDEVELVFDQTPFYAESGGQAGDHGLITTKAGARLAVSDTQKPVGPYHFHVAKLVSGSIKVGEQARLEVDNSRRDAIRRNHSATHLLHEALREVLGAHVVQKGSLVEAQRLRFDFSHGRSLSPEEKRQIESLVNQRILANKDSQTREMSLDAAKEAGAIGLFGEKYGDQVRVVSIGPSSVELCGGTHVSRSGDIGLFVIVSEGGIAQGVRRIEALTGEAALAHAQRMNELVTTTSVELNTANPEDLLPRVQSLLQELKDKQREIDRLKQQIATGKGSGGEDEVVEVSGIKLLLRQLPEGDPKVMRGAADTLRDRLGSGVVVLAGKNGDKASLLVAVTKDLKEKVHAGKYVGKLAACVDGRGGGRPDLAQAGGPNHQAIPQLIQQAPNLLSELLGE